MSAIARALESIFYDDSTCQVTGVCSRERARNYAVAGWRLTAGNLSQDYFTGDFAILWLSGEHPMLRPFWEALSAELRARMVRAAEDLELLEPGARDQARLLLQQVADLVEELPEQLAQREEN